MTQEEKAKAYDKALVIARSRYNIETEESVRICLELMFPELKESEDERIRENIIATIHLYYGEPLEDEAKEMIAWLEKQGEQKPVQEIEPTPIFRIGDILKRKGKDYTFRVDRIQGGYYHCDHNHGAFFPIEEQGNWELVEQKPAEWGDEDEKMLNKLLAVVTLYYGYSGNDLDKQSCTSFLKSLKGRVQPQPKQEWSEEDNIILSRIIADYERSNEEWFNAQNSLPHGRKITWLKSLKDRVQPKQEWSKEDEDIKETIIGELELVKKSVGEINYNGYDKLIDWLKSLRPQNAWKPSDEQMDALHYVTNFDYGGHKATLVSLYEQLKKLKG